MSGQITMYGASQLLTSYFSHTTDPPTSFYLALVALIPPDPYMSGSELDEPAVDDYARAQVPNDLANWNNASQPQEMLSLQTITFITAVSDWGQDQATGRCVRLGRRRQQPDRGHPGEPGDRECRRPGEHRPRRPQRQPWSVLPGRRAVSTVQIVPGANAVELTARSRSATLPPALETPPGGLFPLMSAAFEVDEYRIMSGWPVPVPVCDVRAPVLVSADGAVLDNRDAPTALITNATMRWVADTDYYDQVALLWRPIQGDSSPWTTSSDHAPTMLTNYEYRVGDERFVDMSCLNFDSDTADYMSIDLSLSMGGVSGYSVIMVLNPNSVYGNDQTIIENGLWRPRTAPMAAWAAFSIRDQSVYLSTESYPAQPGVLDR